jgi:FkbM family methyltransferase
MLQRALRPNSNAIDVGAHVGSFLALLIRYAPYGHHVAVEASRTTGPWLHKKFNNATVHNLAASDFSGSVDFYEELSRPAFSSCIQEWTSSSVLQYQVPAERLDDILESNRHYDLVKFDIEGGELAAMRGALETIKRCQPLILFECAPEHVLDRAGVSKGEIYELLTKELGYSVLTLADYLHSREGIGLSEFRRCGLYPYRALNFVARPSI